MSTASTNTIAGPFDRKRLKLLNETLKQADTDGMSRDQFIKFEGQALLISFGRYLAEHVETELTKQDHGL
jgi:hypothetical protein